MRIQKPKKLVPGDKIGIVDLSDVADDDKIAKNVAYLEAQGYKVVKGKTLDLYYHDRSAGTALERLDDIVDTLGQGVKAIILAAGGWSENDVIAELLTRRAFRSGLYRVLQRRVLDRPVIWSGYSDNCYWLNFLLASGGIASLHGLHAQGIHEWSDKARDLWWGWLTKTESVTFASGNRWRVIQGKVGQRPRGVIVASNLDCLSRVSGMEYLDPTTALKDEDMIVVLEDYETVKSDILRGFDSLLYSWILNYQIGRIQAVVFGRLVRTKEDIDGYREWESTFWDDIVGRLAPFKIPVIRWENFGHAWSEEREGEDFVSLPIGVRGEILIEAADRCRFTVDPLVTE